MNYYVCSKYGHIWMGQSSEVIGDEQFFNNVWHFETIEQAEAHMMSLMDEDINAIIA